VIPPEHNGDFVAAMEDLLDVYARPYDPKRPVVCMDEQPRQLIGEEFVPIPAKSGQVLRYDNQYVRNGTVNNFMFFEPLGNWRRVSVRERRTQLDWAEEIAQLLDVDFPDVEVVVLAMDNLNIHKIGSLYERYPAKQAREYVKRLEIHFTPKHGSWLNPAEIEFSVLSAQCLDRRIGDIETFRREVKAWQETRNASKNGCDWQFTTENARIKLKRLYPQN
jgi:transposase